MQFLKTRAIKLLTKNKMWIPAIHLFIHPFIHFVFLKKLTNAAYKTYSQ